MATRFDPKEHVRDWRGRFRDMPDQPDIEPAFKRTRRELLGGAQSTKEAQTRWSPTLETTIYRDSRRPLHDRIVTNHLGGIKPVTGRKPKVTFLVGGAGSGKTTVLDTLPEVKDNAVMVDPDGIKTELPEWDLMVAAGDPDVARLTHPESIDISRRIQHEAMDANLDVVIDGTGAGQSFPARLKQWSDAGYDVDVLWVTADTDVALARVRQRGEQDGRQLDETLVRRIHRLASEVTLPHVLGNTEHVHNAKIFENNDKPRLIYERRDGEETTIDIEALKRLAAKMHEHEDEE